MNLGGKIQLFPCLTMVSLSFSLDVSLNPLFLGVLLNGLFWMRGLQVDLGAPLIAVNVSVLDP